MADPELELEALRVFDAWLDIPEADRAAWIAVQTEGRPELRARFEALRVADSRAELRTGHATADVADDTPPPERLGAYRLVEQIGRGGMGSVYRAERDRGDFAHVVAIKIIKPGLLSERLVERFRRERQILARLAHPNIAQLFDGGETDGSPYIVMEHVDGRPLLEWIAAEAPDRAARLRLFGEVCAAVAFAHSHLVVHRDITPSNVLVTRDGHAKLIDFGISRPAEEVRGEEREEMSRPSLRSLSLTPGYAAPERMTSLDVTTAADIYSLGKVLQKLVPEAQGDAEFAAIVAHATADRPENRYATADALGADVDAWAQGLPVSAVNGGRSYFVRKFVSRHRFGVGASAAGVLALVVALGVAVSAYTRAESARRAERARFEELRSLANYMLFDLNPRLRRTVGNVDARVALAGRAQRYLSALAGSQAASPELRLEAARGFLELARIQGVPTEPNLGEFETSRGNLLRTIQLARSSPLQEAQTAPVEAEALAMRAMVEAHRDTEPKKADATLAVAARTLEAVPVAERDMRWMAGRSVVRRAQLEMTVLDQRPKDMLRLANLLEAEVAQWPADRQRGYAAALDRAYAEHYRAMHDYFTDALVPGIARFKAAQGRFEAVERARRNDPLVLYMTAFNAYVGYGTAYGTDDAQALAFLKVAHDTSDRLLQLEPHDFLLKDFAAKIQQAEAQALDLQGKFAEALRLQRSVVALREAAVGGDRKSRKLNQLTIGHVTLGNIAKHAGDRRLACDSYRAAARDIADLDRFDGAVGYVAAYRDRLRENVRRCDAGAGVGALEALS